MEVIYEVIQKIVLVPSVAEYARSMSKRNLKCILCVVGASMGSTRKYSEVEVDF